MSLKANFTPTSTTTTRSHKYHQHRLPALLPLPLPAAAAAATITTPPPLDGEPKIVAERRTLATMMSPIEPWNHTPSKISLRQLLIMFAKGCQLEMARLDPFAKDSRSVA